MFFFYFGKEMEWFLNLILNLLDPVHSFYAFYFHEIHDQVVQVFSTVDIKFYVSDKNPIVAGKVDGPDIYG